MTENSKGLFIVFEGGEGSGKSTQAKLLYEALLGAGRSVILTKEPGGDAGICKDIRTLLLDPKYKSVMDSKTELMLFAADRAQHVSRVINPEIARGKIVICDRYEGSTFAYQCAARGFSIPAFEMLNRYATGGLEPDFIFWLDIDPAVGLKRNVGASKRDRFEMEDISFHENVRAGFAEYFQNKPTDRWMRIYAEESIEEIQKKIIRQVINLLVKVDGA